jgi:hypothetical protein
VRLFTRRNATAAGAAFLLLAVPGAAATVPAAPANLETTGSTETSVSLAWGPTQPGSFTFVGAGGSWVTVGWGASLDLRGGVVRYEVSKDGGPPVSTTATSYRFSGISRSTTVFRLCVRAFNAAGQGSAPTCGSMTRA